MMFTKVIIREDLNIGESTFVHDFARGIKKAKEQQPTEPYVVW